MTWRAKAFQTSRFPRRTPGPEGHEEVEASFPFSTAAWFFLDTLDVTAPADTPVVVAPAASIATGTASTMNGDDCWPDVLARRLRAATGSRS